MALVLVAMEYSEREMDDPPLRSEAELADDDADDVRTLLQLLLIMETLLPDRERVIFISGRSD